MSRINVLKDYHPNPSSVSDHSPNTGILALLPQNSSAITAFDALKTLQNSSSDVVFCGEREFKDIYALHPGDQLPLHIPGYRYLSIPKVEFPCSLMPMMSPNQFSVVGSCNGILCLRDNENISLWNLSIRRRVRVPSPPFIFIEAAGFGFDHKSILLSDIAFKLY